MSAQPSRLRLAHSAQAAPVAVVVDDDTDTSSGDALILVRPGAVQPLGAPGRRRIAVQLAVHGVGARYLQRLLERASATGWDLDCMAAFAAELERRCAYLVASGGSLPLGAARRRPAHATLWHAGTWMPGSRPADLAEQLVLGARARNDVVLAASSGALRGRKARGVAALLLREGVTLRESSTDAVTRAGNRWAIEVLAVPRLRADHLNDLRERFAGAPRCEWCALPVIGARCRRCAAGAPR
jgi:hypothetical protein